MISYVNTVHIDVFIAHWIVVIQFHIHPCRLPYQKNEHSTTIITKFKMRPWISDQKKKNSKKAYLLKIRFLYNNKLIPYYPAYKTRALYPI